MQSQAECIEQDGKRDREFSTEVRLGPKVQKHLFISKVKERDMAKNSQNELKNEPNDLARLALEIQGITPLSMMFRGFGVAAQSFAISNDVARQLQEAAYAEARSMLQLSHKTAGIWIEPNPVGPISAVTKVQQTQAALLRHVKTVAEENLARFQTINKAMAGTITIKGN
ncbi:MAG: hypothetical protein AAGF53_03760 [Pseudomonadota bacterium]